jgi:hypothetical protein
MPHERHIKDERMKYDVETYLSTAAVSSLMAAAVEREVADFSLFSFVFDVSSWGIRLQQKPIEL